MFVLLQQLVENKFMCLLFDNINKNILQFNKKTQKYKVKKNIIYCVDIYIYTRLGTQRCPGY